MLKTKIMAMYLGAKAKVENFFKNERGDTNFISILIVLALVIILVGIFVAFKDQILGVVHGIVDNFSAASLGEQRK